ncbi:hypothetical protein PVAP13_4NG007100 [Panicum virgatum]|uniref:Uncharacterized protein n=1 Tax=Panicum virgatum TaxID=38727 RepID=A0A8T0T397_PANVG|nr:hypothetical protein PVAP13_4NG007100 [Panicum virgatum]
MHIPSSWSRSAGHTRGRQQARVGWLALQQPAASSSCRHATDGGRQRHAIAGSNSKGRLMRCRCCEDTLGLPRRSGAAAVPGAAAASVARSASAASAPPDRAGDLHARPGPAHRPHRQGPPRRRALRPPPPGRPLLLLLRRRRLQGLLLCVPVPPHAGDAARHRARLRAPPRRRRPRAGLRQLPGPRPDAGGEGDAAAVRALLLPLPQRRVGGGRVRPHHRLPGDAARRHRHRPLPAARGAEPQHERGARLPRPHAPRLPHALVQVDGAPVRGPPQRRRARRADGAGRQVQPTRCCRTINYTFMTNGQSFFDRFNTST